MHQWCVKMCCIWFLDFVHRVLLKEKAYLLSSGKRVGGIYCHGPDRKCYNQSLVSKNQVCSTELVG